MKNIILLFLSTIVFISTSYADVYVSGYQKRDGTQVQPHYRSNPDGDKNNNWSVKPNVNPHNGKEGTNSPETGSGMFRN